MDEPVKHSEPASTLHLLSSLNSTIDEAKLIRQIVSLSDNLRKLEEMPHQKCRVKYLKEEIQILENRLSDCRKS